MPPVRSISATLMAAVILMPSACGIALKAQTGMVGFAETMDVGGEDTFTGRMILSQGGLSNRLEGRGDISERHWIYNFKGVCSVQSGIDIKDARRYDYSYSFEQGTGPWEAPVTRSSEKLTTG